MPTAKREPDFLKTLERMNRDSKLLFEQGEYYNSCYLSGYVLECALKFLLCKYGKKADGASYTWQDVKNYRHNLHTLTHALEECLAVTDGIPPQYRIDSHQMCPYIYTGRQGYPHWDPAYRYGECPAWETKEYCAHYIKENERVFQFIAGIVAGGI